MNSNENLPPQVIRTIMKEIRKICKKPPEGITVTLDDSNVGTVLASIKGPEGTPFDGGVFNLKLVLGQDFPQAPPKGFFITKLFHPNVSKMGEICVNTLKRDWKAEHGLLHVLLVIRCLLIVPNPESALNEEAGKLLLEDYAAYEKRAKLWTRLHAKPKRTETDKLSCSDPPLPGGGKSILMKKKAGTKGAGTTSKLKKAGTKGTKKTATRKIKKKNINRL